MLRKNPMKYNWSIIGHEKQLEMIEADLESGNLAHAYLLAGTNSVGKYTVAKKIAGILQCENDFCHKCSACLQVEKGVHLDTIELTGKDSIKIEEVRKLIERLSMTRQSKYKILLIQGLERMTTEAANSFLKILEEPPVRTIFIMTTDNVRMLMPTIISRVRVVKFSSVSSLYLRDKLKSIYPDCDEEIIKEVSLFSMGKTGKAVHLMENPDARADYLKVYRDIQNFLEYRNIADRFGYVENLLEDDAKVGMFFDVLTHVLRSKLLENTTDTERLIKTLSKIGETAMLLRKNVNARLALENLMLAI
ncbi:DNA polymerase III subunit [Candidatus Peregrinibacteria bacterium]|nr:DNA polymerase III subunit [Candidatus Peregrinibacteria bacterium]